MKVAVFGAGTMGMGIAQVFAQTEQAMVLLCSSSAQSAARGRDRLAKQLALKIERGKLDPEKAALILASIAVGTASDCTDCDLIVEAVPENGEVKSALFRELDTICPSGCIFTSNTSSISIAELSFGISRPVIGMHFFNPAPVMKLVEVVHTSDTPESLIQEVSGIARQIGKTPVLVKDSPGFIVNRLLIPMINEAVGLYANGIASAEDIDAAMKLGANNPMGPLYLADLIGLDVCLAIMETIRDKTKDNKYAPNPMLATMVKEGKLGKKSGQGFYTY